MKIEKARRLITDVDEALAKCSTANAPAVKVTKKGHLRCPWCGGSLDGDSLINLDCAIRWNRLEPVPDDDPSTGWLQVSEGDKSFDTFGYMAECCMALVTLPEGWDESW